MKPRRLDIFMLKIPTDNGPFGDHYFKMDEHILVLCLHCRGEVDAVVHNGVAYLVPELEPHAPARTEYGETLTRDGLIDNPNAFGGWVDLDSRIKDFVGTFNEPHPVLDVVVYGVFGPLPRRRRGFVDYMRKRIIDPLRRRNT